MSWREALVFVVGAGILLMCLVAVGITSRDELEFSPSKFINDGITFALGVVTLTVTFWLSQVVGVRRQQREAALRARRQLAAYLAGIQAVLARVQTQLAERIPEAQYELVKRREARLEVMLPGLKDWGTAASGLLAAAAPETGSDGKLAAAARFFKSDLCPRLTSLGSLTGESLAATAGRKALEEAIAAAQKVESELGVRE